MIFKPINLTYRQHPNRYYHSKSEWPGCNGNEGVLCTPNNWILTTRDGWESYPGQHFLVGRGLTYRQDILSLTNRVEHNLLEWMRCYFKVWGILSWKKCLALISNFYHFPERIPLYELIQRFTNGSAQKR